MPTLRLLALAAVTVLAVPARPAEACGNSVERVVDATNQSIRDAESLLAAGKHQDAAKKVLATFPKALRLDHDEPRGELFQRGQRVLAVAVVRSQGAIKLGAALPGKTAAQRDLGLAWAAGVLRYHAAAGLGGLALTTELAEALAQRPTEASEAYTLLKQLATDDLMPGARGWALLGALEKARGDVEASNRAVQRCRQIAPDDATQCDVVTNA